MFLDCFHLQSLKPRVSLLTLLVVVVGFLSLAFYTKELLRDELLLYTGEQQRSALNLLTSEVEYGLQERLDHLSAVASRVSPALLDDRAALKAYLLEQPFLVTLFNGGVMVFDDQGKALANVRFLHDGPEGSGLTPQEHSVVFKDGSPVIGRIQSHGPSKTPVFSMAVPIRSPLGVVVGALAGEIQLNQPNFLSQLTAHRYGKTGLFFVIEADQRLIFATSGTARLMERLPAAGISPWIDRFVAGFEGTARLLNPLGVEVLAKKIKKTAVVSGVCDGFIGNRMIEQYGRQAGFLLDEGCTPAQVDKAMEDFGFAMGPFRMGDLAGNDIGWAIRKRRHVEKSDMKYSQTADLLCEKSRFGQKAGAGWYDNVPGKRDARSERRGRQND